MNSGMRLLVISVLCASLDAAGLRIAVAQTPGEIPKPWTYEGSMKLQQQYQEQQQQQQEQLRQQQGQQSGQQPQMYPGGPNAAAGGGAAGAALEAARRDWLKRPALPPDRNPLLGVKWTRPASAGTNSSDPFAGLLALAKGGLCGVLFGGGFFEFRADTLVGYDQRTREQELDRVEYRGDARHVVVIPRTTIRLMEFDVEGPNRINWASQNCALVRAGAASSEAATVATNKPVPGKWEMLGTSDSNGPVDMYVDRSTIRKSGNVAQMWDLWDFKSARVFEHKRFLSVRNQYAYDCANVRRRMLSTRGFSDHMGRGSVIASDDTGLGWEPIPANSPFMTHWKTACATS